jgi:excisionase family DNA binding protein
MRDTIDDQHETSMGDDVGAPLCGPGPSLLLTAREVAEILGISRSTVYELLYARRFPSVRIGSSRRVRRSDLETFVRDLVEVS